MSRQSTRRKSNDLSELRSEPQYKQLLKDIKTLIDKSQLPEWIMGPKKRKAKRSD